MTLAQQLRAIADKESTDLQDGDVLNQVADVLEGKGPRCPFGRNGRGPELLNPEDPCPVCGDLGTPEWFEKHSSNCVDP